MRRIYTGAGDSGYTALISGARVPKNHPIMHALGELDELGANIGMLQALLPEEESAVSAELTAVRKALIEASAEIAGLDIDENENGSTKPSALEAGGVAGLLESRMDLWTDAARPSASFELPVTQPPAAQAHLARTVCRRGERAVVSLLLDSGFEARVAPIVRLLNRLSDYLYLLAVVLAEKTARG